MKPNPIPITEAHEEQLISFALPSGDLVIGSVVMAASNPRVRIVNVRRSRMQTVVQINIDENWTVIEVIPQEAA